MKRRHFLATTVIAGTTPFAPTFASASNKTADSRVAIIGHTDRGNYGHGLDTVWQRIPQTEIVGVADADAGGLAAELKKLGIDRGFSDYRVMLQETRPEFVSVAPRHADQHFDMIMACIDANVKGLYVEKPFCRTPAEADQIIAAAERQGCRIAVAHRNRYHPVLPVIRKMVADGAIGRLHELRGRGKGDRRGGGEDLWVLGCHIFNLFEYFGGSPRSCSALMLQDGRHVTAADVHPGNEGLGPLAANEVRARYELADGVIGYFDSIASDQTANSFSVQLIGSKGIIVIHIDRDPLAHLLPGEPMAITSEPRQWIPITSAGPGQPEPDPQTIAGVHNHEVAVRDLVDAVNNGHEPVCDAHAGATAVEMICAV
ncbi:MAG: Gfo/Idh/MocA family oxidoreductase, partial [Planctomycetaceae bacterium]|nr:Gfo/Idh/MocA family oxidoreductase [Planctomycetaceae bacterium]